MLIVQDWASLSCVLKLPIDLRLKQLLADRRDQLAEFSNLSEIARFVIVQPGDSLVAVERVLGFSVLQNPVDGRTFGDPDFSPGWEWIANHGHSWELVFVYTDCGFAHVVLIQNSPMQNRQLRALCLSYAD